MIKQAPPISRVVAMVAFALSCFSIVLFLWINFGGSVPLKAKGYRFTADLTEATLLVNDADVRISGVSVGSVVKSERVGNVARATIDMDSKYAPIPKDTRVTLRQKTLGGETYVELTPGNAKGGLLEEGGGLPTSQARETSEIDEVLSNVLDPETRESLRRLFAQLERASKGRGEDVNDALGHAGPLAEAGGRLLRVVEQERQALRRLVHDGGFVLDSVGRRQGELSALVRAGDRVLRTTARRNAELEETIRILPTTLRELRPTLKELEGFSLEAQPVVRELRPAGRELGPALVDASALAPDVRRLFRDVDDVIDVAEQALPATTRTVKAAQPVFQQLAPALRDLLPVVEYVGLYPNEAVTFFAGVSAALNYTERGSDGLPRHFFRTIIPLSPEGVVGAEERFGTNRHNPYVKPGWLNDLATGLEAIDCENTGNASPEGTQAPPCKVQAPTPFRGRSTAYPQLRRAP
jgi:phospholipid/cholesterol/gamma-HCH transport system substrate-binding protein